MSDTTTLPPDRAAAEPSVIGRTLDELPTPLLLLDLDALEHNIARMAAFCAEHGVAIRPHVKNFKSVDIARLQVAAGAVGITAATARDARAMLDAGIPEALLANQVVDPAKLDRLLRDLPSGARPILAVDGTVGARAVAAAASRAGIRVDVIIELDVGMHRGGTRDTPETLALAAAIALEPALRLVGVMGYEGHTVLERDDDLRAANTRSATAHVAAVVAELRAAGHAIEIVAAGGTNTHPTTARDPVVTELQAGTYVGMDVAYGEYVDGFRTALLMLGQVVSVHGEVVVLDAGGKTFGYSDLALPRAISDTIEVVGLNDEHMLCRVLTGAAAPAIGDRILFEVAGAGLAVLMAVQYVVIRGDTVVDVWPMIGKLPDASTALPGVPR